MVRVRVWARPRRVVPAAVAAVVRRVGWRGTAIGVVCGAVALFGLVAGSSGPAAGDSWPGLNGVIAYKTHPNDIWVIRADGTMAQQGGVPGAV